MRESDSQSLSLPPMRARRGRSLFDRLRQVGKPAGEAGEVPVEGAEEEQETPSSYEVFDGYTHAGAEPVAAGPAPSADAEEPALSYLEEQPQEIAGTDVPGWQDAPQALAGSWSETATVPERPSSYVEEAIAVFNASEFPRRVAGVARSLGAPSVNIRSAEHLSSVVSIVVAWELCWYRYEVDLSEPVVETQVIAQGTELGELAREDRRANAAAGESGMLALAAV
jgi:hypothetical protein